MSSFAQTLLIAAYALFGITACSGGPDITYSIIDDMEGTNGLIEWTPPTGTQGGWGSYLDAQCDHLLPMPGYAGGTWSYEPVPTPYQTLPGITSGHAAHLRTTAPLDNTWGAGMGFDFADLSGPPNLGCVLASTAAVATKAISVDLSTHKGVSFWGMAATLGGATTKVAFRMDDWNTDPRGGRCDPAMRDSPQKACFNSFRSSVDLTNTFTQYTIDFSELKQGAFGYQAMPNELDPKNVFGLSFEVDTPGGWCPPPSSCPGAPVSLTFDIWIDDLYFVDK